MEKEEEKSNRKRARGGETEERQQQKQTQIVSDEFGFWGRKRNIFASLMTSITTLNVSFANSSNGEADETKRTKKIADARFILASNSQQSLQSGESQIFQEAT